jgi:hypothetical protein
MELRCDNKLHGIINQDYVEVRCDSRWCGKRPGVVIIHRFSIQTGELIETLRFKNPARPKKG